jgi:hypothetical protein
MFARRLAVAIAVLAGLIGSQGPEFAQQYRQRLGGALEELNRIISEFDAEAQGQNLTPAEGLRRLEDNVDPLARQRGEDMAEAIERANRLSAQLKAITTGGPLTRLTVVAKDFDPEIARSTLGNYEPAAPFRSARSPPPASPRFGAGRRRTSSRGRSAAVPVCVRCGRRNSAEPVGRSTRCFSPRSGELDRAWIGGDRRGVQSRKREVVAVRVGNRQAGRPGAGYGKNRRQILRLGHAGGEIRERRPRQLDRVRGRSRRCKSLNRLVAEVGPEDELSRPAGCGVNGLDGMIGERIGCGRPHLKGFGAAAPGDL